MRVEARLWYRLALQDILKNVAEYQVPPLPIDIETVIIPPILMVETATDLAVPARTAQLKDN